MFENFRIKKSIRFILFCIVGIFVINFSLVDCGSSISFPSIPSHSDFYNSEKWKDFPPIQTDSLLESEASNIWVGLEEDQRQQQKEQSDTESIKSPWQWSSPTPTSRISTIGDSTNDTHSRTIKFQVLEDTFGSGYQSWPQEHGNYYYGHRYNSYNNRPGYEWVQLTKSNQSASQPQQLQNLYTSGSSNSNYYTTMRYGQPQHGANGPKKQSSSRHFYDYWIPDAYKQKRFRLEIHPGFIAAPIAGLAAFGAAAALTNKPVLVELGLVNRPKPPYGHEKPHQFGPHGHGPPIINHATATATASATVNPVISGMHPGGNPHHPHHPYPQQPHPTVGPNFDNTQFPILKPIDHGPGNPSSHTTGPSGGSGDGGSRPWWSPFAAIIPRLRIDDLERD